MPSCCSVRMLFRSSRLLILGGPTNVSARPGSPRRGGALTGTTTFRVRVRNRCEDVGRVRHLSQSAANTVLFTGRTLTKTVLSGGLRREAVGHACLTLIRKEVSGVGKAVDRPVKQSERRPTEEEMSPNNRPTIAGCRLVRCFPGLGLSLVGYHLSANEARRVHIRLDRVKRPLTKSVLCNKGPTFPHRTLRTMGLRVPRPFLRRAVIYRTPFLSGPRVFGKVSPCYFWRQFVTTL